MFWGVLTTIVAIMMGVIMIFVRMKMGKKPTSMKRIILPPLFMSTGALMFVFPIFRISWYQVFESFIIGMVFSIFLIKSSKFEIRDGEIYLNPSKAFPFILLGLLVIRIILKVIVSGHITLGETGGVFFILAFGMISTWRIAMLYQYVQLKKSLELKKHLA